MNAFIHPKARFLDVEKLAENVAQQDQTEERQRQPHDACKRRDNRPDAKKRQKSCDGGAKGGKPRLPMRQAILRPTPASHDGSVRPERAAESTRRFA